MATGSHTIVNLGLFESNYTEVATFAALPPAASFPGEIYIVTTETGSIFLFNLKRAGMYRSDGAAWAYLGANVSEFLDNVFTLINNADNAGKLQFDLSALTALRKIIMPDNDVDLSSIGNVIGGSFSFEYKANTSSQTPPPGDRLVQWDNATQLSSDNLFVSAVTDKGQNIRNILNNVIKIGQEVVVMNRTNSSQFQVWVITSITDNTTYIDYGVTLEASGGASFTNNQKILIGFFGSASLPSASESTEGIIEIATQAETDSGTDDTRAITPLKQKKTRGIEGFFLTPQGSFGTGGGWADAAFLSLIPVLGFASNNTERAVYMFYSFFRAKFDAVDPIVSFVIYSTDAPGSGEAVRWQLTAKYTADTESTAAAAAQTLLLTQVLTTEVENSRQSNLLFTLDRTLISDQDSIHLVLERLGGDAADTYGSDITVGQSGLSIETVKHNP